MTNFLTGVVCLFLAVIASSVLAEEVKLKPILVTGASSGIGLRVTEVLSKNGYFVYAGARKKEDLEQLDGMKNVESVRLDVTIQSDIDAAVKFVSNRGRGLYGLINNAGVAMAGPLIEVPIEELEWLFDVNVYGPYRITQAFAPLLIESSGRIVNIGSLTGIFAGSLNGHYSMSKHAIEAYTDSLAAEMDRYDVKVSVIEPGSFASNAGKTANERLEEKLYWNESSAYNVELALMKSRSADIKPGKDPIEVANAIMHALSSKNPKRRYLVANAAWTTITINNALDRVLQLNQDQAYTKSRDQLVDILDKKLKRMN